MVLLFSLTLLHNISAIRRFVVKEISRLYGIYHANGGLVGELTYIFGKYRKAMHCSLCDITHGKISIKASWNKLTKKLLVPFDLLHLNERTEDLVLISENKTPCVIAKIDGELQILISSQELNICKKSVDKFEQLLEEKLKVI
jgi:hypothetical protein